jgi:hypothetical protein
MGLSDYRLPEDDYLVALATVMDSEEAAGRPGLIPQTADANYAALEVLPRRLLAAHERVGRLAAERLPDAVVHPLVRLARTFDKESAQHIGPGPRGASVENSRSTTTLAAVVPALLRLEAIVSGVDKLPAAPDGPIEAIAAELRSEGQIYSVQARYWAALTALVRRVLAIEARIDAIEPGRKPA